MHHSFASIQIAQQDHAEAGRQRFVVEPGPVSRGDAAQDWFCVCDRTSGEKTVFIGSSDACRAVADALNAAVRDGKDVQIWI